MKLKIIKRWVLTAFMFLTTWSVWYFNQDRMTLYIQSGINFSIYHFTSFNDVQNIKTQFGNVSFEFDEFNRRKTKRLNGQIIEKYSWQGENRLHFVTDKNDNVVREYLYHNELDDLPYGMTTQGSTYLFIYNAMKSLRVVVDEQQNLVKVIDYDSNGRRIRESNKNLTVDFSYAGGLEEPVSGLLLFLEGVYNPSTGKWLTRIKNDDVIQNLKALNQLKNDEVYRCADTLDTYYHSYLCVKGKCGGLYATEYLNYFNAKGYMLDNSNYFTPSRCTLVSVPTDYNKQEFASCVKEKIEPRHVRLFDVIKHNCHHEVEDILTFCKNKQNKRIEGHL